MVTTADAEIVLQLFDLRREETLRKARHFMVLNRTGFLGGLIP